MPRARSRGLPPGSRPPAALYLFHSHCGVSLAAQSPGDRQTGGLPLVGEAPPRYIFAAPMADLRSMPTSDGVREGASPLRQQLKRETADLHRRLEVDLGLLDSELSLDRYRRMLEVFLGF